MTETEWLSCTDPVLMLDFLRGKVSDRPLRLMLCGWSPLNWRWLPKESHMAVEVAELFADGGANDATRESADAEVWWSTKGRHNTKTDWLARLTFGGGLAL